MHLNVLDGCPPTPKLAVPPRGCNYDVTYNDDNCPMWNLVCNHQCNGDNEGYRNLCGCEPSCASIGTHETCPQNCRQGCFCITGYYRDANKRCVSESACPSTSQSSDCTKMCVREHGFYCNQGRCEPDPCANNPCGRCKRCIRDSKQCFTQPCPQYYCEPINDCHDDDDNEKSGECPPQNPHWRHNNDCHDRCHRDSNCSGRKKCCPSTCGRRCWNPRNNHQ